MDTKTCNRCRAAQPLSAFNKWKLSKDGLQVWCRVCQKAERDNNKTRYAERHARYYQQHKTHLDARSKRWAREHPDVVRETKQRWLANNTEKRRKVALASWKRHYDKNKSAIYANVRQRRARKRNAGGRVTAQEWQTRLIEFNFCCAYCLRPSGDLTQDHMQPLIKGGAHNIENIVPACRSCNSRKKDRDLLHIVSLGTFV